MTIVVQNPRSIDLAAILALDLDSWTTSSARTDSKCEERIQLNLKPSRVVTIHTVALNVEQLVRTNAKLLRQTIFFDQIKYPSLEAI